MAEMKYDQRSEGEVSEVPKACTKCRKTYGIKFRVEENKSTFYLQYSSPNKKILKLRGSYFGSIEKITKHMFNIQVGFATLHSGGNCAIPAVLRIYFHCFHGILALDTQDSLLPPHKCVTRKTIKFSMQSFITIANES